MKRLATCAVGIGTVVLLTLLIQACVPVFSGGVFQTLQLIFKLNETIAAGDSDLVQSVVFPDSAKFKNTWVQVSGRLGGSGNFPRQVKLEARFEDVQTGKLGQRIQLTLTIGNDGTFKASKKIRKNVKAGEMMMVSLSPIGSSLEKSTTITLCVDVVKKKGDLRSLPACGGAGGGGNQVTFTSLQNDIFTPTCAVSGCHSAGSAEAGLVLVAGQSFGNLVNMPSTQQPGFDRVEPGDPNASYLVKKLRGDANITGSRMPFGQAALSGDLLDRVIQWVQNGAPNN